MKVLTEIIFRFSHLGVQYCVHFDCPILSSRFYWRVLAFDGRELSSGQLKHLEIPSVNSARKIIDKLLVD